MIRQVLSLLVVSTGLALAAAPAQASPAWITEDISLRTGPGPQYNLLAVLPAGVPVEVWGCLQGYSWCDVGYGQLRGWVPAPNLSIYQGGPGYDPNGNNVVVPVYPAPRRGWVTPPPPDDWQPPVDDGGWAPPPPPWANGSAGSINGRPIVPDGRGWIGNGQPTVPPPAISPAPPRVTTARPTPPTATPKVGAAKPPVPSPSVQIPPPVVSSAPAQSDKTPAQVVNPPQVPVGMEPAASASTKPADAPKVSDAPAAAKPAEDAATSAPTKPAGEAAASAPATTTPPPATGKPAKPEKPCVWIDGVCQVAK